MYLLIFYVNWNPFEVVMAETVVPIKDPQCLETMLNRVSRIITHIIMNDSTDQKLDTVNPEIKVRLFFLSN